VERADLANDLDAITYKCLQDFSGAPWTLCEHVCIREWLF
jgi:hypothetical protein